jgi:NADP-dependent 3-hydroxy acid dehydrogenase YdfG
VIRDLQDLVVVITGGASGIGAATAALLVDAGASVVLADVDGGAAERRAAELDAGRGTAIGLAVDVTDLEQQQALVATAVERFGRLDVFFANAGVGVTRGFGDDDAPEVWRRMLDVDLLGVAWSVRAALPALRETAGHVVLTSSLSGHVVTPSLYSAAKHGVTALAEALRQEVEGAVRVTCVKPGLTRTSIFAGRPFPASLGDASLPGALDPEDIARAVVWAIGQPPHVDISEIVIRPTGHAL